MPNISPHQCLIWRRLSFLAAFILAAWSALGQYDPDWANHFRIGAMVGFNIKADFKLAGNLPINHPAGVYDDGYVHPPPPGTVDDTTSDWGYNYGSQFSGQALLMHSTTSFSPSSSTSASKNAPPLPGFDLAYGGNLWYWHRARIGWDFGFGLLPISLSANESAAGNASQSTFSFNTGPDTSVLLTPVHLPGGITQPPILPPGYQGTPNAGPLIHSTPTLVGTMGSPNATFTGSQTLDVMLYTLRLGPSVYWDFNSYLGMSVGVGPALGIVSGDLKYNETITTATAVQNDGKTSGTDLVYGWYANATLLCHLVKHGDIYISGQYMPLGNATISGQGRQGTLTLDGAVYVSAGVNWPF
jgi:hypothetical protein